MQALVFFILSHLETVKSMRAQYKNKNISELKFYFKIIQKMLDNF